MSNLLVTTDALKTRMAIDQDLQGADQYLESAIHAAQLHIESIYGSRLTRSDGSDIFYLDSTMFGGVRPGNVCRLLLKNAFVDPSTLRITFGGNWNDTPDTLPNEDYLLVADKGVILVDIKYHNKYIKVEYSSGFESHEDAYDWVKEAILGFAPVVFNFGQTTNRNDEAEKNYKASGEHALTVLSRYRRNSGFTFYPIAQV